jgi:phage shock protein A
MRGMNMPADNSDIQEMSNEQLMEEWTALGEQVTAGRERLLAFSQEYQARTEQERIQRQLGTMTPEQKEAAINAINAMPDGVESEAAAGEAAPEQESETV